MCVATHIVLPFLGNSKEDMSHEADYRHRLLSDNTGRLKKKKDVFKIYIQTQTNHISLVVKLSYQADAKIEWVNNVNQRKVTFLF